MERQRITYGRVEIDPLKVGGLPVIVGTRVTVGAVLGCVASGYSIRRIRSRYPQLTTHDIRDALKFAAALADQSFPRLPEGFVGEVE